MTYETDPGRSQAEPGREPEFAQLGRTIFGQESKIRPFISHMGPSAYVIDPALVERVWAIRHNPTTSEPLTPSIEIRPFVSTFKGDKAAAQDNPE